MGQALGSLGELLKGGFRIFIGGSRTVLSDVNKGRERRSSNFYCSTLFCTHFLFIFLSGNRVLLHFALEPENISALCVCAFLFVRTSTSPELLPCSFFVRSRPIPHYQVKVEHPHSLVSTFMLLYHTLLGPGLKKLYVKRWCWCFCR